MACGSFHREYRTAGVLYELIQYHFVVIVFAVFKTGKGTHSDNIAVTTHYGNGFQQMFRFVTVHDDTALCFQFPGSLIDVQYNDIHAQIEGGFLSAETGAQT